MPFTRHPRTLSGRLVVVTGASSGIGAAISRRAVAAGARVVTMARRADRLLAMADELGTHPMSVDLSDPDATAAACARVLAEHGVPDVVVNNAGSGVFASIEETSTAEATQQITLPYLAAFAVTRGFVEPMLARGCGVVFQINSPVAVVPWPGAVGYAAGRWALRGFTEALRQDLWSTGVQVGSLTPTRVTSDYFEANPGSLDRVPKVEAIVGSMTPEQVAEATVSAILRRPGADSYAPRRWAALAPMARAVPAPVAALFRATGHRRA